MSDRRLGGRSEFWGLSRCSSSQLAAYGCKINSLNAYPSHAVSRDEACDSVTVQLLPQGRSDALFVRPKVPLVVLHLRVKKLADASLVLQLVDVPML
jgi:hypothetical protein